MEDNSCDINHLDSDVLLPPRKRLLAGLKRQNLDGNSHQPSTSSALNEFDNRLNNLMRSHLNNPNLSSEEIVEASRSAATAAVKVAEAARAAAEEKAIKAAKAIAAAKSALELAATVSEEVASIDRYSKKNKMKKHLPVQTLYNKQKPVENCRTDEELARRLHRAMNSSPRISKNSPTSEVKGNKHKRLRGLSTPEKTGNSNGGTAWEGKAASTSNGNGLVGEKDSKKYNQDGYTIKVDENSSKIIKANRLKINDGEGETSHSKEKMEFSDDASSIARKRGRFKQKKLPLSICTYRDRANPKEELKSKSSPSTEAITGKGKPISNNMVSVEPSSNGVMPVEATSLWKCQAFKAPVCAKQNKVMQS